MLILSPFPDPRETPPSSHLFLCFLKFGPLFVLRHCSGQTSPRPWMATHSRYTLKSHRLPAWTTRFSLWQGLWECSEFFCGSCSGDSRRPLPLAFLSSPFALGCAAGVRPEDVGEGAQYTPERFSVLFVWHTPAASGHAVCVAFSDLFLACFMFFPPPAY